MKLPRVSIIFPNFNDKPDVLAFLSSIEKSDYPQDLLEIIMVDNNSSDNSVKAVSKAYRQVKVLKLKKNLGPGQARNKGAKIANGEILFFTDSDQILERKTIKIMVNTLLNYPSISILAPLIMTKKPKNQLINAGQTWNRWFGYEKQNPSSETLSAVDWVAACAMMISRKDFKKLGGFDKNFFFYGEDADLCLRAWKLKMNVYSTPETAVHHGRSIPQTFTAREKYFQYYSSKFLLILKHTSLFQKFTCLLAHFFIFPFLKVSRGRLENIGLKIESLIKAFRDYLNDNREYIDIGISKDRYPLEKAKSFYYHQKIKYDLWKPNYPADYIRYEIVTKLIGSNRKVLDLGCGDGDLMQILQKKGNQTIGLDISPGAIKKVRQKGLKAFQCNLETQKWPVKKHSFDVVCACEIIEHVFDTDLFLEKIKQVLKPNGCLILTTPNTASLGRRLLLLLGLNPILEFRYEAGAAGHIRYFVKKTLFESVGSHNFKIEKFISDVILFDNRQLLMSRTLARLVPTLGKSLIIKAKKSEI